VHTSAIVNLLQKFHVNPFGSFRAKLLTNKQTDKQTNTDENISSLSEVIDGIQSAERRVRLKPNSITLASSELAPNMFEASSCQIPLRLLAPNMFGASSELAPIMFANMFGAGRDVILNTA